MLTTNLQINTIEKNIKTFFFWKQLFLKIPSINFFVQFFGWKNKIHSLNFYSLPKFIENFFDFLSNHCIFQIEQLQDIIVIDDPFQQLRFTLIYNCISLRYNKKLFLTLHLAEHTSIPSVQRFFQSANWLEREVWDMFGIFFFKHIDLRRILNDYGFQGFPLRKSASLDQWGELFYDLLNKRITSQNLQLAQIVFL